MKIDRIHHVTYRCKDAKAPLQPLNAERPSFQGDGDAIVLTTYRGRPVARRIGLGQCRGTIHSSKP